MTAGANASTRRSSKSIEKRPDGGTSPRSVSLGEPFGHSVSGSSADVPKPQFRSNTNVRDTSPSVLRAGAARSRLAKRIRAEVPAVVHPSHRASFCRLWRTIFRNGLRHLPHSGGAQYLLSRQRGGTRGVW